MTLRVFGLTGGIGSGKTTVARIWSGLGLAVVDADQLARQAVAPGTQALASIAEHFGRELILASGELDRAELARRVFGNADATRALNAIVHPEVRRLAQQRFAELELQAHVLGCYEVPLLFEVGIEEALRPVVVVNCSPKAQLERAQARDGASEDSVKLRLDAQLPLAEKAARSDIVIENDGPPGALELSARQALLQVCRVVGCDPALFGLS